MTAPVTVARVRVDRIAFHPLNVRRDLGDLRDLTASIKRFGVMQPITVEQHGQQLRLRAGHRRTAAARLAGVATIPAVIHANALDDDEFVMQALHENIVRRDLDHFERRNAVRSLLEMGCTAEGIGRDLGVSGITVKRWSADVSDFGTRVTKHSKRVNVTALRRVLDNWTRKADAGLSPADAQLLMDELRQLANPLQSVTDQETAA